ncbi:MAG: DUF4197 domain-containing protein [Novosphingobium sp.]
MDKIIGISIARRRFLAGTVASGVLLLPGCASMGGFSMVEAIKRLLTLSGERAFAKLVAPGGFWDSEVARFELPTLFSSSGGVLKGLLTSSVFKDQLQRQLNVVAEKGAERAAPIMLQAVKTMSIPDAIGLVRGGPTAATTFLRSAMGPALINAMIPGLTDALSASSDPILGQAIKALSGVDLGSVAQGIANRADNSIWYQIGSEEREIRANPQSTNDPLLIGVFKVL